MFEVLYIFTLGERAERTQPYETIAEAVAVANEFRACGFAWASVRMVSVQ